ncbi:Prolipoprotein diacylglyceryl transferase [Methylobrevis pamukkalensis]|uniref:Phosphatidylglycerol--prolipoprotein diacylglyceryl transferase n=1 Tax=Methylobrevis pamukkalensis TaxID=1439726 RepID=A0A1E3H592_9HYPH|nr:Prolipoprotein diacylglyceryl transferase [Methylobrevis pamukkalensis]
MLALPFPAIGPDIVSIGPFDLGGFALGPFALRWYALAYVGGLMFGWWYLRRMVRTDRLWAGRTRPDEIDIDDLLVWMTAGVVLGGRIGYVLFYDLGAYLAAPSEILKVWHGGMSFHGGLAGTALAMLIFARRRGLSVRTLFDLSAAAVPLGLGLGRIANFINGELWGRVTDVPWAVVFPREAAGWVPRHPSQLYEAALEGVVLMAVLTVLVWKRQALARPGLVTGVFGIGYGLSRIVVEHFRMPDPQVGYLAFDVVTMGMVLSVPMVLIGLAFVLAAPKRRPGRATRPIRTDDPAAGNHAARRADRRADPRGRAVVRRRLHGALPRRSAGRLLHGPRALRRRRRLRDRARDQPDVRRTDRPLVLGEWQKMGAPARVALVELGPGRGTLMADALRAAAVRPDFRRALEVHLVETSARLRARQAEALAGAAPVWHDDIASLPDLPRIVIANEFFDALPVRQYVKTGAGWLERVVGLSQDGESLAFGLGPGRPDPAELPEDAAGAPQGAIVEVARPAAAIMARLAEDAVRHGGAILAIDYGHARSGVGDTLQALRHHAFTDPLAEPGLADLTAHVDFAALARAARGAGAQVDPVTTQGDFLLALGLVERAGTLGAGKDAATQEALRAAVTRLAGNGPGEMGELFKVLVVRGA